MSKFNLFDQSTWYQEPTDIEIKIANRVIGNISSYEYAYSDDAVLKYDASYSYDNKLIFSNGSSCDVAGVFTR